MHFSGNGILYISQAVTSGRVRESSGSVVESLLVFFRAFLFIFLSPYPKSDFFSRKSSTNKKILALVKNVKSLDHNRSQTDNTFI